MDIALQKERYLGLKFHALVTVDGFVSDFFLTPAGIDDRAVVFELAENKQSIKIIADKGYIDNTLKNQLEIAKDILLISFKRKNSKHTLEKRLRNVL